MWIIPPLPLPAVERSGVYVDYLPPTLPARVDLKGVQEDDFLPPWRPAELSGEDDFLPPQRWVESKKHSGPWMPCLTRPL